MLLEVWGQESSTLLAFGTHTSALILSLNLLLSSLPHKDPDDDISLLTTTTIQNCPISRYLITSESPLNVR